MNTIEYQLSAPRSRRMRITTRCGKYSSRTWTSRCRLPSTARRPRIRARFHWYRALPGAARVSSASPFGSARSLPHARTSGTLSYVSAFFFSLLSIDLFLSSGVILLLVTCLFYFLQDCSAKFTWCACRSHRWF